jgi:hypothetical protein
LIGKLGSLNLPRRYASATSTEPSLMIGLSAQLTSATTLERARQLFQAVLRGARIEHSPTVIEVEGEIENGGDK